MTFNSRAFAREWLKHAAQIIGIGLAPFSLVVYWLGTGHPVYAVTLVVLWLVTFITILFGNY